jgi:D-arabinose 1-dehydrogenase-like Zn-dependent alcohol dehydrogenase
MRCSRLPQKHHHLLKQARNCSDRRCLVWAGVETVSTFLLRAAVFKKMGFRGLRWSSEKDTEDKLDIVANKNVEVKTNVFYGFDEIPNMVEKFQRVEYQGKGV